MSNSKSMGQQSNDKGWLYERALMNYFSSRGWGNLFWRKNMLGYEFDFYGEKGGWETTYLLAECKNALKFRPMMQLILLRK